MRQLVITQVLLALVAGTATAQQIVEREALVRVTTPSTQVSGYLADLDSAYLRIYTPAGRPFAFNRTDISRLEVRHSHAGRGAKILGITGGIAGAGLGGAVVGMMCDSRDCGGDMLLAMAGGGLLLGGVGALTGSLIGSLFPVWTPVDPATVGFRMSYRP